MAQKNAKAKHEKKKSVVSKLINKQTSTSQGFRIIGIGASAGGLEAMGSFFGNMPAETNMAFVVIQHLDPTHIGILPELLQRTTTMKVIQVTDQLKVKPNCVYVIPPNKSMSLLHGTLHLFEPVESRGLRLPIDLFFRSLADDQLDKSIGIILSGMGSDGSLGLKSIKEKNGMVLVQDPATAKFNGMPSSATQAVVPDIVAPAEELPSKLIALLKFIPSVKPDVEIDHKTKSNLDKIIILLRQQTGHDFSLYKKNTLFRRIERRKGVHQLDKIQDYVRFLQENPKEVEILFKELLIGVTSFFRDPAVWKKFAENILPELIKDLPNGKVLRAWLPACSTGEEAYSLAITFIETIEKYKAHRNITLQIFATDIDSDAIHKARKGIFHLNIAADVSPAQLKRFFTFESDNYRVNSSVREMVVFAPQSVIKDPPFTKLDLLLCRNMLIYMEPELQNKLIELFNYSLNPGGILLLGSAETLGTNSDGFETLDSHLKFFKRTKTIRTAELIDFPSSFSPIKEKTIENKPLKKDVENIQMLADQFLLQQFAPASVMVNSKGDIVYITGRTGKYLEPVAGRANWNIYAMAREGLRQELPSAIRKALKSMEAVTLRNIKMGSNGGIHFIDVTVQCIQNHESINGMLMVVFNDVPAVINTTPAHKEDKRYNKTQHQKTVEVELQRSLEELQSTREEMQTSQEELRSTNEELQSTNEELQSTNEELTTSKEEMQSLNEELQTVNLELQTKVSDLVHASNDMKNLLNSTEIATLFIDKDLNIRRFTDPVSKIIKLRTEDIGRPFTDLVTNLQYPEIKEHALQVLKTLTTIETIIASANGKWFRVRIMPYRTQDDRIDGLVLTFTDITELKKLEMDLKKANDTLQEVNKK
jgi:two-component system CheB/CheR fusion protein